MSRIFILALFFTTWGFGDKDMVPSGIYLMISENYEFEQILIFKDNHELVIFEKNHYRSEDPNSSDLLEKYSVFWKVQGEQLCLPLKAYPSNVIQERYCHDYGISDTEIIFFEPGRGDEVEEIKFIKISD